MKQFILDWYSALILALDGELNVKFLEIKLYMITCYCKFGKNASNQQVSSGFYYVRIKLGNEICFRKIVFSRSDR